MKEKFLSNEHTIFDVAKIECSLVIYEGYTHFNMHNFFPGRFKIFPLAFVIIPQERMTMQLAENNKTLALTNKFNKILLDIFTDSKIAKQYKMNHMKSTCIINEALKSQFLQETLSAMKDNAFSLATDGSNDTSLEKMNALAVRIYGINTRRVVAQFINICCIAGPSGGTSE